MIKLIDREFLVAYDAFDKISNRNDPGLKNAINNFLNCFSVL